MPGEVSLAHNGVLFLDELAEFSRRTLDALRQPIEDKKVSVARVNGTHTYPAGFMFVTAMNPCPCGYYPGPKCRCTDYEIIKYRGKISGPIMDRIDIQKEVHPVGFFDIENQNATYSSIELREKVESARRIQQDRYKDEEGMDDIIIKNIINNGTKSHSKTAAWIRISKHFTEEFKIRFGIRQFYFGTINGK